MLLVTYKLSTLGRKFHPLDTFPLLSLLMKSVILAYSFQHLICHPFYAQELNWLISNQMAVGLY